MPETPHSVASQALDPLRIREDFPVLRRKIGTKRLTYLDSAATSQKPACVIDALDRYYRFYNANVHRAVHTLGEEATEAYEGARAKVARFINAREPAEVVFVRNATEAINLVRFAWARWKVGKEDTVVTTQMEHHSNIVPWQLLAKERGANLRYVDMDEEGLLREDQLDDFLHDSPKLLCVTHVSNVLGTINPVKSTASKAHEAGALVLVDAAQSVPHMPIDVQEMDCDFMAFTGHKMLGPTGIGVLYAKRSLLEDMEPFLGGGDMIKEVHLDGAKWNEVPWKFEAGTPSIAEGIGLGFAVDYLEALGMDRVRAHEKELVSYSLESLSEVKGVTIFGPKSPQLRGGIVSFSLSGIHPHDIATILNTEGIAVRSGHHCAQPLMDRLGVAATTRASFYVYNDPTEVDLLVEGLQKTRRVFNR